MDKLDNNTLHDILILLSLPELSQVCQTNRRLLEIGSSNAFWARWSNYKHSVSIEKFNQLSFTGCQRYREFIKPRPIGQDLIDQLFQLMFETLPDHIKTQLFEDKKQVLDDMLNNFRLLSKLYLSPISHEEFKEMMITQIKLTLSQDIFKNLF